MTKELIGQLKEIRDAIFYCMTRNAQTPDVAMKALGQVKESLTEIIRQHEVCSSPVRDKDTCLPKTGKIKRQSEICLHDAAYRQAEITYMAVSMTCGETGKWPLKEAIKDYLRTIEPMSSEISDIALMELAETVLHIAATKPCGRKRTSIAAAIHPYLRTPQTDEMLKAIGRMEAGDFEPIEDEAPEPVSVSLGDIFNKVVLTGLYHNELFENDSEGYYKKVISTVLDAAGVKYHVD